MRNVLIASLIAVSALAPWPAEATGETISVPVDITVKVTEHDYAAARKKALKKGFSVAVYRAAASIIPRGGGEAAAYEIQERIAGRAGDFVASYKFLNESIDYTSQTMTFGMEISVYVGMLGARLHDMGASTGGRKQQKVVTLIHEESLSFMASSDFLLLSSLSEDVISSVFKQNGFLVTDRAQIRNAGLTQLAKQAVEGDTQAAVRICQELKADMIVFGSTQVKNQRTSNGVKSTVEIKAILAKGSDGSALAARRQRGELESNDAVQGTARAIQRTAQSLAREFIAITGSRLSD